MAIINTAKGLRYTIILSDDNLRIVENADVKEKAINLFHKINIFNKEKHLLLDVVYDFKQIKKVLYSNPTNDTSILELECADGINSKYEITPTDVKKSNALKTQVRQITDYIKEKI